MTDTKALKIAFIVILLFAVFAISSFFFSRGTAKADDDGSPAYAYGNSSLEIDVNENKVLHVKENLKVGFLRSVSSITRRIPAKTRSYKNRNGKTVRSGSFLAGISNPSATVKRADAGIEKIAETSFNKNGTDYYLSVGNPDGRFDIWEKGHDERQYEIVLEYDYDLSDDGAGKNAFALTFFDEVNPKWFYYGDDKTNVAKLNVTVNMPKPFDGGLSKVYFGSENATDRSALQYTENSVSFSVPFNDINRNSLRIPLSDGYFDTKVTYYPVYWLFAGFVGVLILACIILTVIYRGRKLVAPVEVMPPVVNPLHYSAYWHGYPQRKDVCTIVLRWAQLGCITIEKDGKRDLILEKLKPLPDESTGAEKRYFNELFRYGDKFYSRETRGFKNRRRKNELRYKVNELVEESEKPTPFVPAVERAKVIVNLLSLFTLAVMFTYFITLSNDWIWIAAVFIYVGFAFIPLIKLSSEFREMRNLKQSDTRLFRGISLLSLTILIPFAFFCYILFTAQYMSQYDYIHATAISIVWVFISFAVLPEFIKKRNEEAQKLYGRMLGFKRFILLADLPRMEMLLKDNPDYFYDVLPYCMVMGLSGKIDREMRYLQVAVPDWAVGFNPAYFAEELFYSVKHAVIVRKKRDKRRNSYLSEE